MATRHQYHLSPGQERATVLALWPLLLDLLQPVMTHATIRTLQDCYTLDLLEAQNAFEICRQVHAREVAARTTDRRSLVRRWLSPALDLDPATADDAAILHLLGPYARTEIFTSDDPMPVLASGDALTDLTARLTDEEAKTLSSTLQAAQLPATVLTGP